MTLYPDNLFLSTSLLGATLKQVTRDWMENLARLGFPTALAWAAPVPPPGGSMHPGGLEQALQALMVQEKFDNIPSSIDFDLGDDSHAYIYQKHDNKNVWGCGLL